MEKDIRNKQIYDLKRQGVPTLRIARHYGISGERVRRICVQLWEKEHPIKATSFAGALPPTIGRVLTDYWGNTDILNNPDMIVGLGAGVLSSVKRIGPMSLRKIAKTLCRFGYIDDPGAWLDQKDVK